jgi:hypothetical protein
MHKGRIQNQPAHGHRERPRIVCLHEESARPVFNKFRDTSDPSAEHRGTARHCFEHCHRLVLRANRRQHNNVGTVESSGNRSTWNEPSPGDWRA